MSIDSGEERGACAWGTYPWFPDRDRHTVHPDDLERFTALSPYGKIFRQDGEVDGYLVLAYGPERFRVLPGLFQRLDVAPIEIGTAVSVKGAAERVGVVSDINWHTKDNRPFYVLRFGDKRHSRRYWAEELIRCET